MAAIYAADVFCDGCAEEIRERIYKEDPAWATFADREAWEEHVGYDLDCGYDSDEYPKHCSDDEESDCPQHCGGHDECVNADSDSFGYKFGYFFGNALTTDGADYVRNAVRDDIEIGDTDSVACTVWYDYYSWIDWHDIGRCDVCAALAILTEDCDGNFVCVECDD